MLFGIIDREDGGYMCPVGFIIPDEIETYEEGFNYLKDKPGFLEKIVNTFCKPHYDEGYEEEFELDVEDLVGIKWSYGPEFYFEKGRFECCVSPSVDFIDIEDLG